MIKIILKLRERNHYDEFLRKMQQDKIRKLWDNQEDEFWDKMC